MEQVLYVSTDGVSAMNMYRCDELKGGTHLRAAKKAFFEETFLRTGLFLKGKTPGRQGGAAWESI
eukprot:1136313-Pelagomonas_calceolata.AAC.16